jgi:hypothetical protein
MSNQPDAANALHQQIMNLRPSDPEMGINESATYLIGYRDARHAAAELVLSLAQADKVSAHAQQTAHETAGLVRTSQPERTAPGTDPEAGSAVAGPSIIHNPAVNASPSPVPAVAGPSSDPAMEAAKEISDTWIDDIATPHVAAIIRRHYEPVERLARLASQARASELAALRAAAKPGEHPQEPQADAGGFEAAAGKAASEVLKSLGFVGTQHDQYVHDVADILSNELRPAFAAAIREARKEAAQECRGIARNEHNGWRGESFSAALACARIVQTIETRFEISLTAAASPPPAQEAK